MSHTDSQPSVLQFLRRSAAGDLSDPELLHRFAAGRDEEAFAALVRRHGGTVLDVCRCVLGNGPDAEDAFQATFLVLARKAHSVRKAASLGSWLHGVAYRTARKALAQIARRRRHEARVPERTAGTPDDLTWREARLILHRELLALPERLRAVLVLCYIQGLTQDQAAASLGLSKAATKKRLERGRATLRARLIRRGLGPTALLTALASPAAPAALAESAARLAAGPAAALPAVRALSEGVLNAMFLSKLKAPLALVAVALGVALYAAPGRSDSRTEKEPGKAPSPAASAPVKDKENGTPAESDDTRLAGEWKVTDVKTHGKSVPAEDVKEARLTFKDGQVEFKGFDGVGKCTVKLDASRTPKEVDFTCLDGQFQGKTIQGIYVVRDGWLRICIRQLDHAQRGRPKGYYTDSGGGLYTLTLERPKAEAAPADKDKPKDKSGPGQ